ncbi:hypothetical protein ACQPZZ_26805 [Microbispora sp. CA-135349]|uniref:hypothetical protein n=1 Tax=Microbispora sp. CA-135349 TaxID=3239953 RepID=UPI003D91466B
MPWEGPAVGLVPFTAAPSGVTAYAAGPASPAAIAAASATAVIRAAVRPPRPAGPMRPAPHAVEARAVETSAATARASTATAVPPATAQASHGTNSGVRRSTTNDQAPVTPIAPYLSLRSLMRPRSRPGMGRP